MKRLFASVFIVAITHSCGPEDSAFCECLEVTDKLEKKSSEILNEEYNDEDLTEQVKLRKEKDSLCKKYISIDGKTSKRLKKDCENR